MIYGYNKKLVSNSKKLRRTMTTEEKHLWYDFLKKLPVTVNRQKIIGNYIVDFFISTYRIVIELDGNQHSGEAQGQADRLRDSELKSLGITVLRYTNNQINCSFNDVCRDILRNLDISEQEFIELTARKEKL